MKKVVKLAKKSKFYITTAIPYVNAEPHLGHALEFVQADTIRRWQQLLGKQTFLTTGSDENSLKNVQAAEERGVSTTELCAINAEQFRELARLIGLHYDSFLRSSLRDKHWPGVHLLWKLCSKDIYKKKYRGLYCVGCETFYTESELREGRCPEHNSVPQVIEEENYFFRLSKYQKHLEKLIESNKLEIFPETRKHEMLSFIKQGLEDFSLSRSVKRAKGWGVPVPADKEQIIYVWFDALNIYQTAIGFGLDEKLYKKLWPCDLHVIGKGILRFHAVYWPAILLSAGLPLPKAIFVHGYVTVDGQKMSKTLGNVVNPVTLIKEYGADRLRYFLLRLPEFDDGNFSEADLVERANKELVENFSNLFYRVTSFVENNFRGLLPYGKLGKEEKATQEFFAKKIKDAKRCLEGYRLNEALSHAMELATELNRYFQGKKPWAVPGKSGTALYFAANSLKDVCTLLYPFIPFTAEKALSALNCTLDFKSIGKSTLKKCHRIKSEMLFKKVEYKGVSKTQKQESVAEEIKLVNNMIPFNEFKKLDLRIGTIVDIKDHPNANKLYILQVDLGSEKRQLVAGLKGIYTEAELRGKQVVVVCNLEQKELRGVKSEGMLLAAGDGTILMPSKKVENGSAVM